MLKVSKTIKEMDKRESHGDINGQSNEWQRETWRNQMEAGIPVKRFQERLHRYSSRDLEGRGMGILADFRRASVVE